MAGSDTFATATNLGTSGSGSSSGSNVGATSEVGEPSSQGKTWWFKWTPTAAQIIYFATWRSAEADPKLRTILQAFTGASVSALTEVTYITEATWKQNYAHWDIGSRIVFNAAAGTTYYIRIDGVGGAVGNFPLVWDTYHMLTRGLCDGCPSQTSPGYLCDGSLKPDVTTITAGSGADRTISFGTKAAGQYSVNYGGGAYIYQSGPLWTVSTNAPQGPHFEVIYQVAGTPTTVQFSNYPSPTFYSSQPEAAAAFRCLLAGFYHDGGDISLRFYDQPVTDNTNGTPNVVFCLYRRVPQFVVGSACAAWTVIGASASCTFTVANQTDIDWSSVTATLLSSGGVSSPSAPQTGVTIVKSGNTGLTFTFNASTPNVIASLKLSSTAFPADITLVFNLNPVFTITNLTGPSGPGSCSGKKWQYGCTINNTGYWTVAPDVLMSFSAGLRVIDMGTCVGHSSFSKAAPSLTCKTGTNSFAIDVFAPVATTPAIMSLALSCSGVSYGTFTFPVTVPN